MSQAATEADHRAAYDLLLRHEEFADIDGDQVELLQTWMARALALQRAEIHARYEAVAVHLAHNAKGKGMPAAGSYDRGVQIAQADAANRIRQVSQ